MVRLSINNFSPSTHRVREDMLGAANLVAAAKSKPYLLTNTLVEHDIAQPGTLYGRAENIFTPGMLSASYSIISQLKQAQ